MTKRTCPSCSKHVINRRLPECEFCGAALPLELLMTPEELEASEALAEARVAEARAQRSADREARTEARKKTRHGLFSFFLPMS